MLNHRKTTSVLFLNFLLAVETEGLFVKPRSLILFHNGTERLNCTFQYLELTWGYESTEFTFSGMYLMFLTRTIYNNCKINCIHYPAQAYTYNKYFPLRQQPVRQVGALLSCIMVSHEKTELCTVWTRAESLLPVSAETLWNVITNITVLSAVIVDDNMQTAGGSADLICLVQSTSKVLTAGWTTLLWANNTAATKFHTKLYIYIYIYSFMWDKPNHVIYSLMCVWCEKMPFQVFCRWCKTVP